MPSLIVKGQGLPAFDVYRQQETPVTEAEYKAFDLAIGQVKNAELLRGKLIDLATVRADNAIALEEYEGKGIELRIARQENQTREMKFSQALTTTSIEALKVDELAQRGALLGVKIQGLASELSFAKNRLQQSQSRYGLELQAADLELGSLSIDLEDAKKLAKQKHRATIDIPARRIA